jgi:hypothetical protein
MDGSIQRINKWSSGKGFFFKVAERDESYFAYGLPSFKVGDSVSFEPQNKKFNNATLVKFGKAKGSAVASQEGLQRGSDEPRNEPVNSQVEEFFDSIDNKQPPFASKGGKITTPQSRDDTITRLACLKAAANSIIGNGEFVKLKENESMDDVIIRMAEKFEKYAKGVWHDLL